MTDPTWSSEQSGHFWTVAVDPTLGLVKIERLAPRFESPDDLRQALDEVLETLERLESVRRGLLLDFRSGPSSNSAAFEEYFLPFLVAASRPFERGAGLVKSAVGKLQLQRYIRQGRVENLQAFINERLALAFLE